jgi:hypothetical protein
LKQVQDTILDQLAEEFISSVNKNIKFTSSSMDGSKLGAAEPRV